MQVVFIGQGEWVLSMNEVTCMEEIGLTSSGTNEEKLDVYLDLLIHTFTSRRRKGIHANQRRSRQDNRSIKGNRQDLDLLPK